MYQQSRKTWRLGCLNEGGRGEAGEDLDQKVPQEVPYKHFCNISKKSILKQKSVLLEGNI